MTTAPAHTLYLASASPRRRELLTQLGIRVQRLEASIDESVLAGESPYDYTLRLAIAKAAAGCQVLAHSGQASHPLLAADTTVATDTGHILGKPADAAEARTMLDALLGQTHSVFTAVAVQQGARCLTAVSHSRVTMVALTPDQRDAYIASGEPFDKAGAYGIQGLAGAFIAHIEGSYSGVMGLPLCDTATLLAHFNLDVLTPHRQAQ